MQDRGTTLVPAVVREDLSALLTDVQTVLDADGTDSESWLWVVFYRLESVVEEIDTAAA